MVPLVLRKHPPFVGIGIKVAILFPFIHFWPLLPPMAGVLRWCVHGTRALVSRYALTLLQVSIEAGAKASADPECHHCRMSLAVATHLKARAHVCRRCSSRLVMPWPRRLLKKSPSTAMTGLVLEEWLSTEAARLSRHNRRGAQADTSGSHLRSSRYQVVRLPTEPCPYPWSSQCRDPRPCWS